MPANVIVKIPSNTKWNSATAISLLGALINKYQGSSLQIILTIRATHETIQHEIYCHDESNPQALAELVQTYYSEAQIFKSEIFPSLPFYVKYCVLYRPSNIGRFMPMIAPASSYTAIHDPMIAITNAMNSLQPNETLDYQVKLFGYHKHNRGFFEQLIIGALEQSVRKNDPLRYLKPNKIQSMIEEKLEQKLVSSDCSIKMYTQDKNRFYILENIIGAISGASDLAMFDDYFSHQGYAEDRTSFLKAISGMDKLPDNEKDKSIFLLTIPEVTTLWHLPHSEMTASNISWIDEEPETCLPEELKGIHGMHIGKSCEEDVFLPLTDRTAHTMIIGKTDTGKTSLMHRMIHEDIKAGRGLCVIDPQGNLIPKILQSSIPDERLDDVVILDPSMKIDGTRYPPPINPLFKSQDDISMTLLGLIHRVYGEFTGTRMEYLLRMALRLLSEEEKPTLLAVRKLFKDPSYAQNLVTEIDSINLENQWSEFATKSERQQDDMTFPLFNRLDRFYDSNQALAVTCHPDPLNIYQLVQNNKIILLNLGSKGNKLDESVRLILGSTIVSQIEAVARAGAITSPPYLLYIDETQNFVHTPLNKMLAEVRQHGLGLILVNQFLKQLTGEVQDAIEGNVGSMFSFEIGHSDARAMSHYMTTFEPDDLTSLGKYKSATSIRHNNNRQPSFLLETLRPPGHDSDPSQAEARELEVRRRSVANYTPKTYDEVISWVREQYVTNNNQPPADTEQGNDWTEEKPE